MSNDMLRKFQSLPGKAMSPTERLVCYMLADHLNDETGRCDPSVVRLAQETSLHRTSVLRALESLRVGGFVSIDKREGERSAYRLNPTPETGSTVRPVAQCDRSQSATTTSRTVLPDQSHPATGPVAQCDPNHKEPQLNHNLNHIEGKRKSVGSVKESKKDRIEKDLVEANVVNLPELTTPPEVMAMWQEWQSYRSSKVTDPIKATPWNGRAARMEAINIEKALLKFPPDRVAAQIRNAISRGWQGAGMDFLKPDPVNAPGQARGTFQEADRAARQALRHGTETIPVSHL